MGFILRWLATAVAVGAAVWLIPGIAVVGGSSEMMAIAVFALVLALINVTIKPILQFLGAPISFLTLGLFYLIINAVLLGLASYLSVGMFGAGVTIDSFGSALLGSIVISIVSAFVNGVLGNNNA